MKECFWSIKLLGCYIQLGKDYKLVIIKKNKDGQWVDKIKINFITLIKLLPNRCKRCGNKLKKGNGFMYPLYKGKESSYCLYCNEKIKKL